MVLKITEGKEFIEAYEILKNKQMPIKVAYGLARAQKKVREDVEFYTNKFQEVINEYAETDENGNFVYTDGSQFIKVKEGLEEECQSKIAELEELTTELDIDPLTLDDLGAIEIDPDTMRRLMPIME